MVMKYVILGMGLMILGIPARGQYMDRGAIATADSLRPESVEWIDVDTDGMLDIMVFSVGSNGSGYLEIYQNLNPGFQFVSLVPTNTTGTAFHLADYDRDNRIDVITSGADAGGDVTRAFLNSGSFAFTEETLLQERGALVRLADLNMDGTNELILSRDDPFFTKIYRQNSSGWEPVNDSIKVYSSYMSFHDYDGDMDTDIFLSGMSNSGTPVQAILTNEGHFSFAPAPAFPVIHDAVIAEGEFNGDARFDILVSGKDAGGLPRSLILYSNGTSGPTGQDTTLSAGVITSLFAADLSSDGLIDINVVSAEGAGVTNVNLLQSGGAENLPAGDLISQRFGDADRDGDLDLVQLREGSITFLENTVPGVNLAPARPPEALAFTIYDRTFLYWEKPEDDHTDPNAISFDLTLQGENEDIMVGEFDLLSGRRTLVSHGNMGFRNYALLKDVPSGQYSFYIQAVDNAFHAGPGGICKGTGPPCGEIAFEEIEACRNEKLVLEAEEEALWFSFTDGYLGKAQTYAHEASASDTLFAVVPGPGLSCTSVRIYNVKRVDALEREELVVRHACLGSSIHLQEEDSWNNITWSSALTGFISNSSAIDFVVNGPDTVTVSLTDGGGCALIRKTAIVVSKPDAGPAETTYQILKGERVQLSVATPGIVSYSWQPSDGLDHTDIPNPMASPETSTEYTVTLSDSLGCVSTASVLILVEYTAFIPTLFTPNQDGKNDVLKIYGMDNIQDFSFRIYNREGSLVFRTENASAAMDSGWDGSVQGILQPAGVYHWKIKGTHGNGSRLLLNGKESGSIVLIR